MTKHSRQLAPISRIAALSQPTKSMILKILLFTILSCGANGEKELIDALPSCPKNSTLVYRNLGTSKSISIDEGHATKILKSLSLDGGRITLSNPEIKALPQEGVGPCYGYKAPFASLVMVEGDSVKTSGNGTTVAFIGKNGELIHYALLDLFSKAAKSDFKKVILSMPEIAREFK